jgi:hypothetical protein
MASKSKRLKRIAEVAPGCIDNYGRKTLLLVGRPTHCIFATAVGVEICRQLGIDANPMSVEVSVLNMRMYDWLSSGKIGERPDDAWGVGVVNRNVAWHEENGNELDTPRLRDGNDLGGWSGHLVAEVPRLGFLDLNSGPFSRSEKSMMIPDGLFYRGESLGSEFIGFGLGGYDGSVLLYRRSDVSAVSERWKISSDWLNREEYAGDLAREIITKL